MDTGTISDSSRLGVHEDKNGSFLKCLLIYTGCFVVLSFFVYFLFITNGKTLIRYLSNYVIDSYAQKYTFAFEFRRFLNTLFQNGEINTWDWTIGLGADAYEFNITSLISPSAYILYFTPAKYVDFVCSLTIVARIYLSGIAFMLFSRKISLDDCQTVMGSIAYSFCPWIVVMTIYQGSFAKATMLFPIILLGEEKIIRRESPLPFILSVGYMVFTFLTFAYTAALIVLLYFPIRMATDGRSRTVGETVKTSVLFILSGMAGIMLAGESLVLTLLKFGETSGSTGKSVDMFWTAADYLILPMKLMTWDTFFGSSSIIAIAAIGIVMLPLIVYKAFRRETDSLMTVILFVFVLFPAVNSVFNFFSYPTGRWMYTLAFFYALAAAECFDKKLLMRSEIKVAITAAFAVYAAYILYMLGTCDRMFKIMVLLSCAVCTLIIVIIWIFFRPSMDSGAKQRLAGILVIATICVGIVLNYNIIFLPEYGNYLSIGQGQEDMNESPQRAAQGIKDEDFYRVDQAKIDKVNRQIYFGNRSEYVFFSYIDVGWLELNKLIGNNQGYYLRVWTKSNDNRFGPDLLMGVKYFLGSYGKKDKLSRYAGFGYEPYQTIDGVEVLKNKYSIGLGCMFDSYIRRTEWEKLTFADREYAMLMGLIVPDDEEMPSGMRELKASDIHTGAEQVPYEISSNKKKTRYRISCENDDDHQLLMTFENVQADGDSKITLNVKNGNINKSVHNTRGNERGFPEEEMRDLTVNLGCGEEAGSDIKVKLNGDDAAMASGVTFDDVKIYSMPLETYQECAEKLVDNRLNITRFDNDHITGTVSTDVPKVLYFSIFDNSGWDVYVDGKKAEIRDEMDIAFIGVDVEPGDHEIELIYHSKGVVLGWIITAAGIVLTVIAMLLWRSVRKAADDGAYDAA